MSKWGDVPLLAAAPFHLSQRERSTRVSASGEGLQTSRVRNPLTPTLSPTGRGSRQSFWRVITFALAALVALAVPALAQDKKEPIRNYGIGTVATAEQIAGWDIDIRPDGTGAPPGKGSVKAGEALETYRFEDPDSEVVLQHKNCQFSPRVLGIRTGQKLSIVNADPTFHNTHAVPRANPEWNQSQPSDGPPIVKTFRRPELLIPVKDNQHPWEKAYISVMDHPFFAVTDEQGNYEIRGLPPGKYKLVMWHEVLGEQEIEITLQPNENKRLDVLFSSEKALKSTNP